jgi:hypothetical protein
VKKKQRKENFDVHLLTTNAIVIFWKSAFCNTTLVMSPTTPLQHRFNNIVFCSIGSTSPLQHCLLQHHFNIAYVALSCATSFMLLSVGKV